MTEQEARKIVDNRLKIDPAFKRRYDAHMAKYAGKDKLESGDLKDVNGGLGFMDITKCPSCGAETFVTISFGVYWWCESCPYTEWF